MRARKHLLIAGGIGITPFMAHDGAAGRRGRQFRTALHLPHRIARHLCAMLLQERYGRRVSDSITTTVTSASISTGCCRRSRSARISMSAARPA